MKKILSILIVLLMLPVMVNAIEIDYSFTRYGGSKDDYFNDVDVFSDGGYVVGGYYQSTDIEGLENKGGQDAWLLKFNNKHELEWQRGISGSGTDTFRSVITTSDGYIIGIGYTRSQDIEGFENIVSSAGLITKFDKSGNVIWNKVFDGNNEDDFYDAAPTQDGGFVAVGYSSSSNIENFEAKGQHDAIIIKFDKDGNIEWKQRYGGNDADYFQTVIQTNDGGFIAARSTFSKNIDGVTLNGGGDFLAVKYDKNGNFLWQSVWGGNSSDSIYDIENTMDGGFIAVGLTYSSNIEGLTFKGMIDAIIIKYDKNGKVEWKNSFGGDHLDQFDGVVQTADGGYLAIAETGSEDIEGFPNKGAFDAMLIRYDKNGKEEWKWGFAGSGFDDFHGIKKLPNGEYIIVSPSSTIDFTQESLVGDENGLVLVLKLDYNEIYNNPTDNGDYTIEVENGKATLTPEPDEGYVLDDVEIKDVAGNDIDYVKNDSNIIFDVKKDLVITVVFAKDYTVTLNPTLNGTATLEKVKASQGRVKAVPDEGYELDDIVIKDTTGKLVVYEEKDGYYYFDVNDDLVITVTFKELPKLVVKGDEENPKTADAFIYYACAVVSSLFGIWSVEQYRKTVKE